MRVELSLVSGQPVTVVLPRADATTTTVATTEAPAKDPPNPILPVGKEILWGAGTFLVLFLIMRLYAFPKVRQGMDARAASISGDLLAATAATAGAQEQSVRYEAALAAARAEGAKEIDAARQRLDAYRGEQFGVANAAIAGRRAEVTAEIDQARATAMAGMEGAVLDVAHSASELILGRSVDREAQRDIASQVLRGAEVLS